MNPQLSTLNSESFREQAARPSVQLHIERLVLDGLPVSRGQGELVQAAIETELTHLLAEQGLSSSSAGAVPHLSANSIQVTHDSKPAQLGHQIARAIHGSLTPAPALMRETRFSGAPHR
jgi:hypothetical protein